jgi:hypothetical protein
MSSYHGINLYAFIASAFLLIRIMAQALLVEVRNTLDVLYTVTNVVGFMETKQNLTA